MASIIVRAFDLTEDNNKNSLESVKDANKIAQAHKKDVETLYDLGITNGKSNGEYAPTSNIQRGEFAVFLDRAMNQ